MLAAIHRVIKKDIVKVFSLTAISTLVRMLTGFVSIKVISSLVGPSGIALLGQLSNFSTIFLTLSTGGINSGVTKYVAQYSGSPDKIITTIRTAFWIVVVMSILAGIILIFGSDYFSNLILHDKKYSSIVIIFGFTIIFYSLNGLLLSVINGFKEFKKYVVINITSSIIGLSFACSLSWFFGIYGALLSAVLFESVVFFVTVSFVAKNFWRKKNHLFGKCEKPVIFRLLNYSLMAFISAATVPVSQLIIRSGISNHYSLADAGLWEGMNRISAMYLSIITSSLAVYYLPRLSEIKTQNELRSEIISTYRIVIPPLIVVSFTIYIFRDFIIQMLFNERFKGMNSLFGFQLIGDFFKISSWILSYQMLAKSMTKVYIITEILSSVLFVSIGLMFIRLYGNVGATMGYSLCYFIYFLSLIVIFRKLLFYKYYAE